MNDELDALDRSHEFEAGRDAWLKETLNQLVAGDPKLGERLAELDDRAAEASDDASEAERPTGRGGGPGGGDGQPSGGSEQRTAE